MKTWMLLIAALLLAGCTTRETQKLLDDTPMLYSAKPDRVNLWPAYYKNGDTQSVVWPIGKVADDSFAIRPLVFVRHDGDPDMGNWEYSLCWPLAVADLKHQEMRALTVWWKWRQESEFFIVPVLWSGPDYFVLFPIYWHFDSPWRGQQGCDSLFPAYIWNRDDDCGKWDLWLAPPFFRICRDHQGAPLDGHLWPLYGSYEDHGMRNRFWLWPLGWSETSGETGGDWLNWTIPLYYAEHEKVADKTLFVSPLAQARWEKGRLAAHGVLPLYWRCQEGNIFLTPLAGWTQASAETGYAYVTPLLCWGKHAGEREGWLAPFFYFDNDPGIFLSLPYGHNDRKGWRYWLTPLAGDWQKDAGKRSGGWILPLAIWSSEKGDTRRSEIYTPLFWNKTTDSKKDNQQSWERGIQLIYNREKQVQNGQVTQSDFDLLLGLGLSREHSRTGSGEDGGGHDSFSLLGCLWTQEDDRTVWRERQSIKAKDITIDHVGQAVIPEPVAAGNRHVNESSTRSLLLLLYRYSRQSNDQDYNRQSQTLLWPLWHAESCSSERKIRDPKAPMATPPRIAKENAASFQVLTRFGWRHSLNTQDEAETHQVTEVSKGLDGLLWHRGAKTVARKLADGKIETADAGQHSILGYFWQNTWNADGSRSLDAFPGFSSDRRADGSTSFSWLWRFYRHECGANGSRKLDLLFLPIIRHEGK
jgi:hypothetical protein